eukprot:TRINITY_DN799_c0_g1_i2.p1 TRINITY_DN799_c0_g1~~TRINITY_DN799_c0_g1_i2.p1  ORF type:complete len:361 (-),score=141.39 TRINITY_DN799_c0_g1_i2:68-1096(-)
MQGQTQTQTQNQVELPSPPTDSVSCLSWSYSQNFLIASSWDGTLRCWQIENGPAAKAQTNLNSPILNCSCLTEFKVVAGLVDGNVVCWDLATNSSIPIGKCQAGVKTVNWIPEFNLVATGSWDRTVRFWDLRQPNPITVNLPERIYAADWLNSTGVVGLASKQIAIFDIRSSTNPAKIEQSALNHQIRTVAISADSQCFTVGSVEGRANVNFFAPNQNKTFSFKCHRIPMNHQNQQQPVDIYTVNQIHFHPQKFNVFATCGSDGVVFFWDKEQKSRLKAFEKLTLPITCCKFNREGKVFAYSMSYDWSQGYDGFKSDKVSIFAYAVSENDLINGGVRNRKSF